MSDYNSDHEPDNCPPSPPSSGEIPEERESPQQFGPCTPPLHAQNNNTEHSTKKHTDTDTIESQPPLTDHSPTGPYFTDRLCGENGEIEFDKFDNPRIRLDTLHMKGTDEMCTTDISQYFLAFGKVSMEWVDDNSCNVRFKDKRTATEALFSVGFKPLDTSQVAQQPDSDVSSSQDKAEVLVEVNPWRVALPHFKNMDITLRYATTADRKQPGAALRSRYYVKYGNPHRGELRPDHLLSKESRNRKRQVKKRLGSQINVISIQMDPNLEGYIADIESSDLAPSKFMKLYSELEREDCSEDSDDNFIFVAKSSVDLRTKLNAKKYNNSLINNS